MVRIYDENMTEVHLPKDYGLHYGSYPLDLEIGSFEYETVGRKDIPSGRSAMFRGMIIASNLTDVELKAERVYEFFRTLGTFFVAKESSPFKLLKVKVTEPYTIGVGNGALVDYEIPLNVQAPFFKQSLHSTREIDNEGVRFNDKWAYGMGLSDQRDQWKYSFTSLPNYNPNLIPLNESDWEIGSRWSSGLNNADPYSIRLKMSSAIPVENGKTYTIRDQSPYDSRMQRFLVHCFDSNDNLVYFFTRNRGSTNTFVAQGTKLVISLEPMEGFAIPINFIKDRIRIKLEEGDEFTGFETETNPKRTIRFYNAGTEDVKLIQQKESMVRLYLYERAENIEIYDGETTFRINRGVSAENNIKIQGHLVTLSGINILHQTNAEFLTVKKGWNEWEIRGSNNFYFEIDFRFLYD